MRSTPALAYVVVVWCVWLFDAHVGGVLSGVVNENTSGFGASQRRNKGETRRGEQEEEGRSSQSHAQTFSSLSQDPVQRASPEGLMPRHTMRSSWLCNAVTGSESLEPKTSQT